MTRPLIALLTDFGLQDYYVGVMKGVMLGICPDAALVDITHNIAPQDVLSAAEQLADVYQYFPARTIFLSVVDPGVGSSRRGLAVEAGGYRFVAPDNGLLSRVIDRLTPGRIVSIENPQYARAEVSRTFEGRDRFGPAAAWLAAGVELTALGPAIDTIVRLPMMGPERREHSVAGQVVRVDRFGNLITNIDGEAVAALGRVVIKVAGQTIGKLVGTYSELAPGEVGALVGSSNSVEISANGESAARILGVDRGVPVLISAAP